MAIYVLEHPLAGHLLARLRDKETPPEQFRALCRSLTMILVLEATKGMRTRTEWTETPLTKTMSSVLDEGLAVVPVLRAGLGMLESIVQMFPSVSVGYIGLERDEQTAEARTYYSKLPALEGRFTVCVDPMLATGGSASSALSILKAGGATSIAMVSVVAAPEGVNRLRKDHPDVSIVTAALDEGLNDRKYIVPGLGDFGDRLYGTL
jgi:uracil phosphoribosyltransferase